MTEERVRRLLRICRDGEQRNLLSSRDAARRALRALMPDYEHEAELAALLDPRACERCSEGGSAREPAGADRGTRENVP